jgi:photosystem II stability/assembly factor-like uncharacterized protein
MRTRALAAAATVVMTTALALPATGGPAGPTWVLTRRGSGGSVNAGTSAFRNGTAYAIANDGPLELQAGTGFLRSTDFGATWTLLPPPRNTGPVAMSMGTTTRGFAVVIGPGHDGKQGNVYEDGGGLLVTADGARTWHRYDLPRDPGTELLNWVTVHSAPGGRSALVAGWPTDRLTGDHTRGADVIWVADGGRTMRRTRLGTTEAAIAGVSALDDRTGVAVVRRYLPGSGTWIPGQPCCIEFSTEVYITHDAGRSWHLSVVLPDEILSADWLNPGWLVLASWRHGTIYVSQDGGKRFAKVGAIRTLPAIASDDGTHPPCLSIDFVSERIGYATTCLAGQWRTTSGGESWTLEASPNQGDDYLTPATYGEDAIAAFDTQHAVSGYNDGLLTRQP